MQVNKEHARLPLMLMMAGQIPKEQALALCQDIENPSFKDFTVLNPLMEVLISMSLQAALSTEKKIELLQLAVKDPKVSLMMRDILFFNKGHLLRNATRAEEIKQTYQRMAQEMFGMPDDAKMMEEFRNKFGDSKRYPNGLISYAARLRDLRDQQTYINLLGQFAAGVIRGTYPDSRYDISGTNEHLQTVFGDRPELLEKWKRQVRITVRGQSAAASADADAIIRKGIEESLRKGSLGFTIPRDSKDLKEEYQRLTAEIKNAKNNKEKAAELQRQRDMIAVEQLCEEILNPATKPNRVIERFHNLKNYIPELNSISEKIKPQKQEDLFVETTDSWDDLLLMGTEVDGSCQKIDGTPSYNRCLLAYMMDGKNKPIVVKDKNGRIVARAIVRILWDETAKNPVLFLEKMYTKGNDPRFEKLISGTAVGMARDLGLVLTTKSSEGQDYPNGIRSLGSPAPAEYVDALAGVQEEGKFIIGNAKVLFAP